MIEVDRLTKNYGLVAAIRDVSFSVSPGQIVGFLGPNGAGKSTTMRILACFMPASSGAAKVAGYDVFSQSMEVRQRIGYLPENVPLYTDMRVAAYLDFVAEVKGVARSDRRRRVADVMDRCMVADVQNRLIGKLSKGYRQRVGLAQAIVSDPEVLILDEPTIGLDPQQITEIRSLIKSLAGQHTVILSTHILPEVSMVCDAVIIINKGGIVAQGPIDTLVEQFFPTSRLEVEIVGPSPAVRERIRAIPGVLSVQDQPPANGAGRYTVEAARGRDVRAEIFQLAAQQRWDLLELKRVGLTLEEVFIRVVAGEESADGFRRGLGGGGGAVKIWAIFKKEMRLYFTSPVAWVVFTIFLLIAGYFFYSIFAFFTLGLDAVGDEPADGPRPERDRQRHAAALLEHQRDPAAAHAAGDDAAVRRGAALRHHRAAAHVSGARRGRAGREVPRGARPLRDHDRAHPALPGDRGVLRAARVGSDPHRVSRAPADGRDVHRRRRLRLVA